MKLYEKNPCYTCGERTVGCHVACEKYKSWSNDVKSKKDVIYGHNKVERMFDDIVRSRVRRIAEVKHVGRKHK